MQLDNRPLQNVVLREIEVPTATAIVCDRNNPYMILVGKSNKHALPVLPGGKIDQADILSASVLEAATTCITRELREEVHCASVHPVLFEIMNDRMRDPRVVSVSSLRGTLAEHLVQDLEDSAKVRACYGVPDYIFVVNVDRESVSPSSELTQLYWLDARDIESDTLSAGHGDVARRYLQSLAS